MWKIAFNLKKSSYIPRFSIIDQKILEIFFYLAQKGQKTYCWPSQQKIIEILSNLYDIKISLRTLNYHLASLEEAGFIKRIRRIRQGKDGKIEFNSTLYQILKKARKVLKGLMRLVGRTKNFFKDLWSDIELEPKLEEFGNRKFANEEEARAYALRLIKERIGG